jgi:2-polyprenyl-3-methyl-5-hydroxy-6-metoxy-1,4-benzoquinol methylase
MVFSASAEIPTDMYEHAFADEDHRYHQYAHEAERVESQGHHVAWAWRQFFQRTTPIPADRTLLDIGCSTGVFLSEARRRGWTNVAGNEVSPSAAAITRSRVKCDVWEELIEQAAIPDASFSAVTVWEVIEHVPDPQGFVRRISALLKPGGYLAISTPNWESRWERDTTDFFRMPPYHLSYWTPPTLSRLLHDAGFVSVVTARKPFAWTEELGPSASVQLPLSLFRSFVLGQKGNRLFAIAQKPA